MSDITKFSDPSAAYKNAIRYGIKPEHFNLSSRKDKKYMIYDEDKKKWVHFGQMGAEDYLYHQNEERRIRYLKRASKIKGNWRENKLSANNLAMFILWT